MYRGDRYDEIFQITDPGIYILDFSNWDADSRIGATLTIDDELRFSTSSAGVPRDLSSSMIYWNNFWGPDPETRPTAVQSNADFGITYADDLTDPFAAVSVGQEEFTVVLPRHHPLAKKQNLSLSDLKDLPLVSLPSDSRTRRLIDGAASSLGFSLKHVVTVSLFAQLLGQ